MGQNRLEAQLIAALRAHLTASPMVVPEAGRLFWSIFVELSATRTYHMTGPNPISYAEIAAYCRVNRWPLEPRHVRLIRAMDEAWLKHAYSRSGSADGTASTFVPRQPINPAAFDAVFG